AWWKIWSPTWEAMACLFMVLGYLAIAPKLWAPLKKVLAFFGDLSFSAYVCHFMLVGLIIGDPFELERMPGMMLPFHEWFPGIHPMLDAGLNTVLLVLPAAVLLSVLFF